MQFIFSARTSPSRSVLSLFRNNTMNSGFFLDLKAKLQGTKVTLSENALGHPMIEFLLDFREKNINFDDHVATKTGESWNEQSCIMKFPTNSFGKITFSSTAYQGYRKPAKYVRLAEDSDMSKVVEMMVRYWNLNYPVRPELVVSVVGGGKMFRLSDLKQKEIFNRGLIRSIHTTRGWLLTSGCHMGVARAVGEAVKEGQSLEWYEEGRLTRTIHCIGIAPWGLLRNRQELINPDESKLNEASYSVGMSHPRTQWSLPTLDASHSHFLLVDDGYRNREKGTAQFRASLEKELAAPESEGGMELPVLVLMVEGGANSIEHVLESLLNQIPVLICAGTGRAADLLADAVGRYSSIEQNPDDISRIDQIAELRQSVEQGLRRLYPSGSPKPDTYLARMADHVFAICENHRFVSVFRFEQRSDLDLAILSCMMDRSNMNLNQQLHLALAWDRPDCAAARLQEEAVVLPRCEVFYLLTEALVNNQTEFCRVLLDYGWSAKRYLTVTRLRELYSRTVTPASHLWPLLGFSKKRKKNGAVPVEHLNLSHVYNLIKYCTRRFQNQLYSNDHWTKNTDAIRLVFPKPFQELFLWAVLVCRVEMALFLWDYLVEEPLTMALIGTVLCEVLGDEVKDFGTGIRSRYGDMKSQLEERAVGLVNQAYSTNREKTLLLIQRPARAWGNLNSLAMAALAFDKDFLSTACCQNAIFKVWKKGFDAGALRITICTFTVFPLFWLIVFDEDQDLCPNGRCPPGACTCATSAWSHQGADVPDGAKNAKIAVPIRAARPPYVINEKFGRADPRNIYPSVAPIRKSLNMKRQSLRFGPSLSTDNQVEASTHCGEELKIVKRITWIKKFLMFYSAPIVKFTNHTLWYILYLILYCFVILFHFRPEGPSWLEWLLYAWQVTFAAEEVRELLTYPGDNFMDKAEDYWYFSSFGTWNRIDVLSLMMSGVAFSFRWHPLSFPVARLLMTLTLVVYIVRLFKVYFVNSYLGPKVVMLKRMSWDLAMFLMVVVVFLVSYSVASQSLLKQNKGFYWGIFYDLFLRGIWEIFGELNDAETQGTVEGCSSRNETWYWDTECSLRSWPVPFLLATYLFFGNILMINMLIAIFTHVFDEIQQHSEQIWKYEMYFLVEEFRKKPLLPPPFIVLEHLYQLGKWLKNSCKEKPKEKQIVIGGRKMEKRELEFLEIFEKVSRSDFIDNRKRTESSKLENMIAQLQEGVSSVIGTLAGGGLETPSKMTASESQQMLRSMHSSLENIRKISGDI